MQLEAVAQALYPDTTGMYEYEPRCTTAKITGASWAHCVEQAPFYGDYGTNSTTIDADTFNIKDPQTVSLAKDFMFAAASVGADWSLQIRHKNWLAMINDYGKLLKRCGQLIQGQQ